MNELEDWKKTENKQQENGLSNDSSSRNIAQPMSKSKQSDSRKGDQIVTSFSFTIFDVSQHLFICCH